MRGNPKARTPADNQTVRNVFVIGPDKKIKLILVYPMTTGRNFDEVLRVIDSAADLYWSKTLLSLLSWCFMLTAGTR
jgi:alkyl hydroperoxide reductase subunit AhpC